MEEAAQTPARQSLADLPDRHPAADAPGPRQRLPARLHRVDGRLRQPAGARRQLRRALDRDLLRHRRRPERPRHGRDARRRPPDLHPRRLLRPALLARPPLLHHRLGQGRLRHPPAPAASAARGALRRRRLLGGADPGRLRHHRLRQLRQALGRRHEPDARPLRARPSASPGPSTACSGAARPGPRSGRRSGSRWSRHPSPPPSAFSPPGCSFARTSAASAPSSSGRCSPSRSRAR